MDELSMAMTWSTYPLAHPSGPSQDFHPDFCRFLWEKANDRMFIMGNAYFPSMIAPFLKFPKAWSSWAHFLWDDVEWRRSGWLLAWCMALRLAHQFQMIETECLQFPKSQVISGNLRSRVKRHRKKSTQDFEALERPLRIPENVDGRQKQSPVLSLRGDPGIHREWSFTGILTINDGYKML